MTGTYLVYAASYAISRRARYAVCGTELAYMPMPLLRAVRYSRSIIRLCACYAACGTELAHGGPGRVEAGANAAVEAR
eukprot:2701484-Rhodomonas_salina.2